MAEGAHAIQAGESMGDWPSPHIYNTWGRWSPSIFYDVAAACKTVPLEMRPEINKNAQKNGASVPLLARLVAACLIVLAICLCMAGSSGLLRYAGPLSKLTGAPPAK